eukprot:CAMPEP_0167750138 /NCGR_PEP_ID=MMETSP0110_2-20121227/5818_1 /TAXON_ID=629695 /ORGANISM="Gymnochlora sp., Strain CCMP2014" /LENGTH=1955 /DNA_ID=CAMNT_0007635413 /DNA_START=108 /DNA_END=5975 /DNA_ORIENTATION=-
MTDFSDVEDGEILSEEPQEPEPMRGDTSHTLGENQNLERNKLDNVQKVFSKKILNDNKEILEGKKEAMRHHVTSSKSVHAGTVEFEEGEIKENFEDSTKEVEGEEIDLMSEKEEGELEDGELEPGEIPDGLEDGEIEEENENTFDDLLNKHQSVKKGETNWQMERDRRTLDSGGESRVYSDMKVESESELRSQRKKRRKKTRRKKKSYRRRSSDRVQLPPRRSEDMALDGMHQAFNGTERRLDGLGPVPHSVPVDMYYVPRPGFPPPFPTRPPRLHPYVPANQLGRPIHPMSRAPPPPPPPTLLRHGARLHRPPPLAPQYPPPTWRPPPVLQSHPSRGVRGQIAPFSLRVDKRRSNFSVGREQRPLHESRSPLLGSLSEEESVPQVVSDEGDMEDERERQRQQQEEEALALLRANIALKKLKPKKSLSKKHEEDELPSFRNSSHTVPSAKRKRNSGDDSAIRPKDQAIPEPGAKKNVKQESEKAVIIEPPLQKRRINPDKQIPKKKRIIIEIHDSSPEVKKKSDRKRRKEVTIQTTEALKFLSKVSAKEPKVLSRKPTVTEGPQSLSQRIDRPKSATYRSKPFIIILSDSEIDESESEDNEKEKRVTSKRSRNDAAKRESEIEFLRKKVAEMEARKHARKNLVKKDSSVTMAITKTDKIQNAGQMFRTRGKDKTEKVIGIEKGRGKEAMKRVEAEELSKNLLSKKQEDAAKKALEIVAKKAKEAAEKDRKAREAAAMKAFREKLKALEMDMKKKSLRIEQADALLKLKEAKFEKTKAKTDNVKKELDAVMARLAKLNQDVVKCKEDLNKHKVSLMKQQRELALVKRKKDTLEKNGVIKIMEDLALRTALKEFEKKQTPRSSKRRSRIARVVERRLRLLKNKQVESVQVMKRLISGRQKEMKRKELVLQKKNMAKKILEEETLMKNAERDRVSAKVFECTRALLKKYALQNCSWVGQKDEILIPSHDLLSGQFISEPIENNAEKINLPSKLCFKRNGTLKHPLKFFRAYRICPEFDMGLTSLAYSHKVDPLTPLCRFDLHGRCNDELCGFQHIRDFRMSHKELIAELATYSINPKALKPWVRKLNPSLLDVNAVVTAIQAQVQEPFYISSTSKLAAAARGKRAIAYKNVSEERIPRYREISFQRNRKHAKRFPARKSEAVAVETKQLSDFKRIKEGLRDNSMPEEEWSDDDDGFLQLPKSDTKSLSEADEISSESESNSEASETTSDSDQAFNDDMVEAVDFCRFKTIEQYDEAVVNSKTDVALWLEYCLFVVDSPSMGIRKILNILSLAIEANSSNEILWCLYLKKYLDSGASTSDMQSLVSHAVLYTKKHRSKLDVGQNPEYGLAKLRACIWSLYISSQRTYSTKCQAVIEGIKIYSKGADAMHNVTRENTPNIYSDMVVILIYWLVRIDLEAGLYDVAVSRFSSSHNDFGKEIDSNSIPSMDVKICPNLNRLHPHSRLQFWLGYIHLLAFHNLPILSISHEADIDYHYMLKTLEWWSKPFSKDTKQRERVSHGIRRAMKHFDKEKEMLYIIHLHWIAFQTSAAIQKIPALPRFDSTGFIKSKRLFWSPRWTLAYLRSLDLENTPIEILCNNLQEFSSNNQQSFYHVMTYLIENEDANISRLNLAFHSYPPNRKFIDSKSIRQDPSREQINKVKIEFTKYIQEGKHKDVFEWLCYLLFLEFIGSPAMEIHSAYLSALAYCSNRRKFSVINQDLIAYNFSKFMTRSKEVMVTKWKSFIQSYLEQLRERYEKEFDSFCQNIAPSLPVPPIFPKKQWRKSKLLRILFRLYEETLKSEMRHQNSQTYSNSVLELYAQTYSNNLQQGSVFQMLLIEVRKNYRLAMRWVLRELDSGTLSFARRGLKAVTKWLPRDPYAWSILAHLDSLDGNPDSAQKNLLRGLEFNPSSISLHIQLIRLEKKYASSAQVSEAYEIASLALGKDFMRRRPKNLLNSPLSGE